MTIKQHGGIFGRNPTFNDVDVEGVLTIDGSLVVNGASMAPIYRGTWNASTNTPTLASGVGTQGDFYIVSVAGDTNLDGASTWGVGDWVLFNGTTWQRIEGGVDGDFGNILVSGNTISTTDANGDLNLQPDGTGEVVSSKNIDTPSTNQDKLTWNIPLTEFTDPTEGEMQWNLDWGTVELGLRNNARLLLGQKSFYYAKNQTGSQIDKGTLVMATDTLGTSGHILIGPWDGVAQAQTIMGIANENIANGDDGYIVHFGEIRNINTTGTPYTESWNDFDIIYAGETGGLTNVEPTAPNTKTIVALVIKADANGVLFVRPTFSSSLRDDDLVELGTLSDNDIIRYNSANSRFENESLGTMADQDANSVSITGGSVTGITDLAVADGGTGASDASGARSNLGLGTISTQDANSVNIDGGNIDGTAIGVSSASSGAFSTLTASDDANFDSGTLFVDASADRVGIGTTSPELGLDVVTQTVIRNGLGVGRPGAGSVTPGTQFYVMPSATTYLTSGTVSAFDFADSIAVFTTGTSNTPNINTKIVGGQYNQASTTDLDLIAAAKDNNKDAGFRITAGCGAGATTDNGYLSFNRITTNGSNISTGERMRISSGGVITFSTYGAGTLSTNASGVISASDGRYKTKTRDIDNALSVIDALNPTYYQWDEDSPFASEYEELGFIAQEVASVIPEASPEGDQEDKFRNYHDRAIIAMLVKGMQELKAELDELKGTQS